MPNTAQALAGAAAAFKEGIPTACHYSPAHKLRGEVQATVLIKCGPLGECPACEDCAAFYRSMGGEDE